MPKNGTFYKRGFLSLIILKQLAKKPLCGQRIAEAIEAKKGKKPQPGTLYPALKTLEEKGLIRRKPAASNEVCYELTAQGKKTLKEAIKYFRKAFAEILR